MDLAPENCTNPPPSPKKRSITDSSNVPLDNNIPTGNSGFITSPVKKRVKIDETEAGPSQLLKNESFRRVIAQSQFDCPIPHRKEGIAESGHIPIYKKISFPESPARDDPYAITVTPERPRKLVRAKASTNLLGNLKKEIPLDRTPEMKPVLKSTSRLPSSPHPGKDVFNRMKEEAPYSPLSRLKTSSQSFAALPSTPTTPMRTPSRSNLKASGISTSALRMRQPITVAYEDQINKGRLEVLKESPRMSRRQRSISSSSLTQLFDSDDAPSRNLRKTPERSQSLERSRSLDRLVDNNFGMNLRNTPERRRSRESSQEKSLPPLRKASSTITLVESIQPVKSLQESSRAVSASSLQSPRKFKKFEVSLVTGVDKLRVSTLPNSMLTKCPSDYFTAPNTPVAREEIIPKTCSTPLQAPTQSKRVEMVQQTPEKFFTPERKITPRKSALRTGKLEKSDRKISFGKLNVYYFGRDQGFEVVPREGEVALGMEYAHFDERQFTIMETRRPKIDIDDSSDSELSEDEDPGYSESCFGEKHNHERVKILEAAGVVIDKPKKLNLIRQSRKQCGCSCRGGVCKPAICECIRFGIKCQVDGPSDNGSTYPCTCYNASLCSNENGRDEYNYDRIVAIRRSTIQRWKDSQKTGLIMSPIVTKFTDEGETISSSIPSTPTQEEPDLSGPKFPVTPIFSKVDAKGPFAHLFSGPLV